jgi:hypothetical protein
MPISFRVCCEAISLGAANYFEEASSKQLELSGPKRSLIGATRGEAASKFFLVGKRVHTELNSVCRNST